MKKCQIYKYLTSVKSNFSKSHLFIFDYFFIKQFIANEMSAHIKSAWAGCSINSNSNLKIDHSQSLKNNQFSHISAPNGQEPKCQFQKHIKMF